MNELRRDPITGRWIIIRTDAALSAADFKVKPNIKDQLDTCPFCYGKESLTPYEITAHRKHGSPNSPGWTVRVVPNKYPALRIEGDLQREGIGVYDWMNGVGAHEVIVETPDHFKDMADLSYAETEEVIWEYISRSNDLRRDPRFKYILIFKNYGKAAGATLEHPHSQLIAMPIVPKRVKEELEGSAQYFDYRERCVFCDIIAHERAEKERIIYEDDRMIAFCPYMSRFPYEIWILPKRHCADFVNILRDCIPCLAKALKLSLLRIKRLLSDPPYNFIIHTSPINGHERDDYHWHIEIMPKLAQVAGFEWGSGFYINPVTPYAAAKELLSANID